MDTTGARHALLDYAYHERQVEYHYAHKREVVSALHTLASSDIYDRLVGRPNKLPRTLKYNCICDNQEQTGRHQREADWKTLRCGLANDAAPMWPANELGRHIQVQVAEARARKCVECCAKVWEELQRQVDTFVPKCTLRRL